MPKMRKSMDPLERLDAQKQLQERLETFEISIGGAVREIRQKMLGLSLEDYARLARISKNTLAKIEHDDSDVRLSSMRKALAPIDYRLLIAPSRPLPDE